MNFLYCQDEFKKFPKQVDEMFKPEADELASRGHQILILDMISWGIRGEINRNQPVVYRGWMLKPDIYLLMMECVWKLGGEFLTSYDNYLLAHYLPYWYENIKDLTAYTKIYPYNSDLISNIEKFHSEINRKPMFIKDYVKSTKNSVIHAAGHAVNTIQELIKFRGAIEGGICVREYENYIKDSEERYFVFNGNAYSSCYQGIPEIVNICVERFKMPFFSIDIALRNDNIWRVVEIGDGGVSDLKEWLIDAFAVIWE